MNHLILIAPMLKKNIENYLLKKLRCHDQFVKSNDSPLTEEEVKGLAELVSKYRT